MESYLLFLREGSGHTVIIPLEWCKDDKRTIGNSLGSIIASLGGLTSWAIDLSEPGSWYRRGWLLLSLLANVDIKIKSVARSWLPLLQSQADFDVDWTSIWHRFLHVHVCRFKEHQPPGVAHLSHCCNLLPKKEEKFSISLFLNVLKIIDDRCVENN